MYAVPPHRIAGGLDKLPASTIGSSRVGISRDSASQMGERISSTVSAMMDSLILPIYREGRQRAIDAAAETPPPGWIRSYHRPHLRRPSQAGVLLPLVLAVVTVVTCAATHVRVASA